MRTERQQRAGLDIVGRRVMAAGADCVMYQPIGDVVLLACGSVEVVYASDGYDVWYRDPSEPFGPRMGETDVSAEQAAQALIDEYRHLKNLQEDAHVPDTS